MSDRPANSTFDDIRYRAVEIAFLSAVIFRFRDLLPVLEEHIADYEGEVLPHLLMADITTWLERRVVKNGTSDALVRDILEMFESTFENDHEDIDNLLSASFLEHLPRPGQPAADLREMVGPKLRKQLSTIG